MARPVKRRRVAEAAGGRLAVCAAAWAAVRVSG